MTQSEVLAIPPAWKDLSRESREYVKELRAEGWSLWDAIIQAACFNEKEAHRETE